MVEAERDEAGDRQEDGEDLAPDVIGCGRHPHGQADEPVASDGPEHSMLIAYWHMFTTGEAYRDLGGDYFQRRDPERATQRLLAKLQALGHHVTLQPAAP